MTVAKCGHNTTAKFMQFFQTYNYYSLGTMA